ncbi:unnamed protein product [Brachionus calyciflorus]|uniref:Uncharacterized protein n=1 Tax=Brachionus calyciflorus TaxID=104777 RepID=A0A813X5D3_9BILA|nr:unnamed protein product [Brachionus calyciflorus]
MNLNLPDFVEKIDVESKNNSYNISSLLEYFQKLNEYLNHEEEFDKNNRKIRRIIFKYSILANKLIPFYSFILTKLNSDEHKEIFVKNPQTLYINNKELISNAKFIKTLNELLRLIVDLTSTSQFISINHNLIFKVLSHFDIILKHTPANIEIPDILREIALLNNQQFNPIDEIIAENLLNFKNNLVKSDIFGLIGESFKSLIEFYNSLSSTYIYIKSSINVNVNHLKNFKLLKSIIFDCLILNLCLIRNLSIDNKDSNYSLILNRLFENNLGAFLIELVNLSNLNKSFKESKKNDKRFFVCYSLVTQILALLFGKISNQNVENFNSFILLDNVKNDTQIFSKNLLNFSIKLFNSNCCINLINEMVRLITRPIDLIKYFDISYFFWLVKFSINELTNKKYQIGDREFTNLRKKILNYDLIAFIVFSILKNFENLIFDSNQKNVILLRLVKLSDVNKPTNEPTLESKFKKVTNINSLKLLSLSLSCLYQILESIHFVLDSINTYKMLDNYLVNQKEDIQNFFIMLNEFINFEELKKLFPLLMRFYCYNNHVYSDSLVKSIFLTNQLFLNTIKNCYEIIEKIRSMEIDSDSDLILSDTNATKNSSSFASSTTVFHSSLNTCEIFNMYANSHTSYIIKDVLTKFVNNDAILNRCVIDFLDSLMRETNKHEYLFHMNFALALANIATLDNYRLLDQRTKDLVSNMLSSIKRLCKKRPNFANKILFNINCSKDKLDEEENLRGNKRVKLEDLSSSDFCLDTDSFSYSKFSTCSSSLSSLKSSNNVSSRNSVEIKQEKIDSDDEYFGDSLEYSSHNLTELTTELKILIENEFLYCIKSLNAFRNSNENKLDSNIIKILTSKNDYLFKIFTYMVDLLQSDSMSNGLRINSRQIFNCLINMKFTMSDKINYLNELNSSYLTGGDFPLGINIGFGPNKTDFFKSNECISLREACSTEQFKKHLTETYVKYLIDKLSIKSKKTRNAIFWIFNILKSLKMYLSKNSIHLDINTNEINQYALNPNLYTKLTKSSSLFQMKLISLYHAYNLGTPLIPFTYELQQVFHSVDFSNLLDVLGIARTITGFPFIPNDWLDTNKQNLHESLSIIEKCLCI